MKTMTITIGKRAAVRVALLILWETLVALRHGTTVTFEIGDDS
jgi:hypothetical protein